MSRWLNSSFGWFSQPEVTVTPPPLQHLSAQRVGGKDHVLSSTAGNSPDVLFKNIPTVAKMSQFVVRLKCSWAVVSFLAAIAPRYWSIEGACRNVDVTCVTCTKLTYRFFCRNAHRRHFIGLDWKKLGEREMKDGETRGIYILDVKYRVNGSWTLGWPGLVEDRRLFNHLNCCQSSSLQSLTQTEHVTVCAMEMHTDQRHHVR